MSGIPNYNEKEINNSVAVCNFAEAVAHEAEADYNRALTERTLAEVTEAKSKIAFDNTQDYRHGYLCFAADINQDTTLSLQGSLRRLSRMRPGKPITIEVNSPGGSIIEGFSIIDSLTSLRNEGIETTIVVRGQACSMAAVVLQGAARRVIGRNSFIMLHRASFGVKGTAHEVEDAVEETKMMEAAIYGILAERSGRTVAHWRKKLSARKDVWFTAEEAVECGLADAVG